MWGEIFDLKREEGVVLFHLSHSTLRWSEHLPVRGGNWHSEGRNEFLLLVTLEFLNLWFESAEGGWSSPPPGEHTESLTENRVLPPS